MRRTDDTSHVQRQNPRMFVVDPPHCRCKCGVEAFFLLQVVKDESPASSDILRAHGVLDIEIVKEHERDAVEEGGTRVEAVGV